jgi:hypothetical protein
MPEIIEIIDDDADAFGDLQRNVTVNDTGGPRWVGPVAAAALIGLISFGVATSAPSHETPKAVPVTSTSIASTTTPTTTPAGVAADDEVAYYAADPPRQFTVQYANLHALDHAPFYGYGYELWATPDSSATSGTWFSVATYRGASLPAPDAYLIQAGRLSITISHTDGGQSVAQFSEDDQVGVTITSFGWSDDDLVRLATSIQASERSISFTDAWFKPDHKLISTVQPWLAVQSVPAEQVAYVSSADPANSVVVTVGQRLRPYEGGADAVRQVALRFLLDRNTPFTVDGHAATAGAVVGQDGRALATWIVGDRVFTVSASMPVSQLITIARTVHEVASNEWEGMKFQAERTQVSSSRYERSAAQQVASGTGADSVPWSISVASATSGGQKQLSWSWSSNGLTTTPNGTPQIHTVVDSGRTYVLADLPRSIAPSGSLVVSRAGVDVTVPFVDIGPNSDRIFAGYAFSDPGQYSVRIVGSDGNVRAVWPTL